MKILKIEFRNINSLKGAHEIDFTSPPFTGSSLFAITGPTGSGKSTILDVISLALFNHVPRLGRISKTDILTKGAILTRNQKEAFAKVTYESKAGFFASEWSISTNRNDNLRDYEMNIFDLATEKALDLKKSDVPGKNEELIGLSYDQFIKAVLLAQGEFAHFLKAKKDERGELLEKITGTGIYRQLGIKAFQKKKEVTVEIEQQQKEIELLQKNLIAEEDHKALSESLHQKEEKSALVQKAVEKLEQNIRLKNNIRDQFSQIEEQNKKKELAEAALLDFEVAFGNPLAEHEKIQIYGDDLRLWKQLSEACKEVGVEKNDTSRNQEKNNKSISECLEKIGKFLGAESTAEAVEEDLQRFSEKVRQLQIERDHKRSLYKNLQEKFELEVREVPFRLNGDLKKSHLELQELRDTTAAAVEELLKALNEIDIKAPDAEKQRLRKSLERTRRAQQQSTKLENISTEILRFQEEEKKIIPELEELPKTISLSSAKIETFEERLEKLNLKRENELFRKSFEDHRLQLKDGEPCPLCGSPEHPFATDFPEPEDGLQAQIKITEKELFAEKNKLAGQKVTLKYHEEQLLNLRKSRAEKQQQLESLKCVFEEEFGEIFSEATKDWEETCSKYDQQILQLERYELENKKLRSISAGLPILIELQKVLEEGKEVREELEIYYTGKDISTDCSQLQKTWSEFQHHQKSLSKLAADLDLRLEKKSSELKELEEELSQKVVQDGCEDILDALQKLLPEQKYAELRKKREFLRAELSKFTAALSTLADQLHLLREKEVEADTEKLSEELELLLDHLKLVRSDCEELRRQIKNDWENRKKIEEIESQLAEKKKLTRRWELLNHLIGDSNGKRFNDFAQDLNLAQLLRLANVRLRDLSDRYILDKPTEEEDDGLVAIDEHMGGQRRSVKTLSGGETFILSLSMALALSDLASKNVDINSLFIDEGFGTLDPETLDQTLDTLEKLQAESSKTIGVISHVDSLKERISTQIQLKRNGQGYSSLELKG